MNSAQLPFTTISTVLLLAGSALLLHPLLKLVLRTTATSLPPKTMGKVPLASLLLALIAIQLAYLAASWKSQHSWHDLQMPCTLFTASLIIWTLYNWSILPLLKDPGSSECATDGLLGIYNRRHIELRLQEEIARSQRYQSPLSVFMLDVDQLSGINHQHGHAIGDQVLIHLARLLQDYLRESDTVARYGADEIVVATPNTLLADAQQLAERIRARIEAQPLLLNPRSADERRVEFKVSIGVATMLGSYDSPEKLLERTEMAMQQASEMGGNRVQVAGTGHADTLH